MGCCHIKCSGLAQHKVQSYASVHKALKLWVLKLENQSASQISINN